MGLIKALVSSARSELRDQYLEYFYCDAIPNEYLMVKGLRRQTSNSTNKGNDNIITNGSRIAVNEGQCMIIVAQGAVVEVCAEAGEFIYDSSSEPSIFAGNFGESLVNSFKTFGYRIIHGGEIPNDQRVYFVNTKEILGNKFGTAQPLPFRVVDERTGIDFDISVRCNGEYSFHIADPILFYKRIAANVTSVYRADELASQAKAEMMSGFISAFAEISAMGIRYNQIGAHTDDVVAALNKSLSEKWLALRGIEMVSLAFNSVSIPDDDLARIKEIQSTAVYSDPSMAAARLATAQANAMESAAKNTATGPMMAFAGMNMANMTGGLDQTQLFQMGQAKKANQAQAQQAQAQAAGQAQVNAAMAAGSWTCTCGHVNTGKFCDECGAKNPGEVTGWECPTCHAVNKGKFCSECGAKKPAGALLYKCDKCGWEPEDPSNPPKFCPECGDPFNESDIVK